MLQRYSAGLVLGETIFDHEQIEPLQRSALAALTIDLNPTSALHLGASIGDLNDTL